MIRLEDLSGHERLEVSAGLGGRSFPIVYSPFLHSNKNDKRLQDLFQVVVDIDNTLFPVDRAVSAYGIPYDLRLCNDYSNLQVVVLRHMGREDLLEQDQLHPEKEDQWRPLLYDFFAGIQSDPELLVRAGVYEDASDILHSFRDHGLGIHLFTHRPESTTAATKAWLQHADIPYDSLQISFANKIDYCKEIGASFIVDDKPSTVLLALQNGISAFSLDWPYVRGVIQDHGGYAAASWSEIGALLFLELESKIKQRQEKAA